MPARRRPDGPRTSGSQSTSRRSSSASRISTPSSRARFGRPACRRGGSRSRSPSACCSTPRPTTSTSCNRLKSLGVSIALDDFGTGYSSLSYLTRFPFDKIKIDPLVHPRPAGARDDCAAITAAVINLGRTLDILTVAEGVETVAQFEALRAAGVGQIQGYLFGRPAPADRLVFAADDQAPDADDEPMVAGVA